MFRMFDKRKAIKRVFDPQAKHCNRLNPCMWAVCLHKRRETSSTRLLPGSLAAMASCDLLPLLFLVSLTRVLTVFAVPKCVVTPDGSPCAAVTDWKDNLLCRIQGPADESGARTGGYVADSIPKPEDDLATVKRKLWAQNIYARLTVVLNTQWVFQNQYPPLATMAAYEQVVSRVGSIMYGVNWVTSPKPCGVANRAIAWCGDKGNSLTPTECP